MAHSKKSRKVGKIGVSKANSPKPSKSSKNRNEITGAKTNKKKGNKAGSRQQIAQSTQEGKSKANKNTKVGSTQAIDLSKYKSGATPESKPHSAAIKYKSPADELAAIESDTKLDALLEKQDSETLSKAEAAYVAKMSQRYQDLCELLGIDTSDSEANETDLAEEKQEADDPFDRLDAIKLDDFKD